MFGRGRGRPAADPVTARSRKTIAAIASPNAMVRMARLRPRIRRAGNPTTRARRAPAGHRDHQPEQERPLVGPGHPATRVRTDAEERSVAERDLPGVAHQEVEAHRRDRVDDAEADEQRPVLAQRSDGAERIGAAIASAAAMAVCTPRQRRGAASVGARARQRGDGGHEAARQAAGRRERSSSAAASSTNTDASTAPANDGSSRAT